MIGSAAFLFPEGRIEPDSVAPPSTMYCTAAMSGAEMVGCCLTLVFTAGTIREHVHDAHSARPAGGLSLAHSRGRRHDRANDSSHAEG